MEVRRWGYCEAAVRPVRCRSSFGYMLKFCRIGQAWLVRRIVRLVLIYPLIAYII